MNARTLYGSDLAVRALHRLGCEYVALNPGASFRALHDSLTSPTNVAPGLLLALHEEIAVAIAHGYWKMRGVPMAVALHDTVGLLHASMALFNAWVDRAPVLALVGTGPLDSRQRRPWIDWVHTIGDQTSVVRDFAVWTGQPTSPGALLDALQRSWDRLAMSPSGPAVLAFDIALQEAPVAQEEYGAAAASLRRASASRLAPDPEHVAEAARTLDAAVAPLILTDQALDDAAFSLVVRLAERTGAGLLDVGGGAAFPVGHDHDVTEAATAALERADWVLFVDVRDPAWILYLSDGRQRGVHTRERPPKGVRIGVTPLMAHNWMQTSSNLGVDVELVSETVPALEAILDELGSGHARDLRPAYQDLDRSPPEVPSTAGDRLHPGVVGRALAHALRGHEWTVAAGNLGRWGRRTLRWQRPKQHLGTSLGAGLGYQMGASIGAALAARGSGHVVVNLQGDGDLLYTPQALWTAAHHDIPLLVVVDSNRTYYQDEVHQRNVAQARRDSAEGVGPGVLLHPPDIDFAAMARSFGVEALGPVRSEDELADALPRAIDAVARGEPVLVAVETRPAARTV